ncbi:cell surface glycoprotein 1-like [Dendropsophus ebraccatus]|uniref:cell surface glycoprotein 1-like n=1 Tax=Dendropsophus ebraccatus TaxID=150705 RepID=UPI003831EAF2
MQAVRSWVVLLIYVAPGFLAHICLVDVSEQHQTFLKEMVSSQAKIRCNIPVKIRHNGSVTDECERWAMVYEVYKLLGELNFLPDTDNADRKSQLERTYTGCIEALPPEDDEVLDNYLQTTKMNVHEILQKVDDSLRKLNGFNPMKYPSECPYYKTMEREDTTAGPHCTCSFPTTSMSSSETSQTSLNYLSERASGTYSMSQSLHTRLVAEAMSGRHPENNPEGLDPSLLISTVIPRDLEPLTTTVDHSSAGATQQTGSYTNLPLTSSDFPMRSTESLHKPSPNSPTPSQTGPQPSPNSPTPSQTGPQPGPSSPTPSQTGPQPGPNSPTPSQTGPQPSPNSPTPSHTGPQPGPNSPTPSHTGPQPGPNSPTPSQTGPQPGPNSPTPSQTGPQPGPNSPTPSQTGPQPGPNSQTPSQTGPQPGPNSPTPSQTGPQPWPSRPTPSQPEGVSASTSGFGDKYDDSTVVEPDESRETTMGEFSSQNTRPTAYQTSPAPSEISNIATSSNSVTKIRRSLANINDISSLAVSSLSTSANNPNHVQPSLHTVIPSSGIGASNTEVPEPGSQVIGDGNLGWASSYLSSAMWTIPTPGGQLPGSSPTPGGQLPGSSPTPGGQLPGSSPTPGGQLPGSSPTPGGQLPGSSPTPGGQLPGSSPTPGGQLPGSSPTPGGQLPGSSPTPGGQLPGSSPTPGGQLPGSSPTPGGQLPGSSPTPGGQLPGSSPTPGGQLPGSSPTPGGQLPGSSPTPGGQLPGSSPTPGGQLPGSSPTPGGQLPGSSPTPGGQLTPNNPNADTSSNIPAQRERDLDIDDRKNCPNHESNKSPLIATAPEARMEDPKQRKLQMAAIAFLVVLVLLFLCGLLYYRHQYWVLRSRLNASCREVDLTRNPGATLPEERLHLQIPECDVV